MLKKIAQDKAERQARDRKEKEDRNRSTSVDQKATASVVNTKEIVIQVRFLTSFKIYFYLQISLLIKKVIIAGLST